MGFFPFEINSNHSASVAFCASGDLRSRTLYFLPKAVLPLASPPWQMAQLLRNKATPGESSALNGNVNPANMIPAIAIVPMDDFMSLPPDYSESPALYVSEAKTQLTKARAPFEAPRFIAIALSPNKDHPSLERIVLSVL